ncbi:carbohydrate ABC transporter membrane protein 2 (CUT1 family) [Kribbella voronezhensis]|uniref:Carbohydrate ABC transporter membrane protein 2 (CUT1 family) n=1 Tax=Kribbella voronezhensis TaxID=2512212 RepID=A0A4R7SWY3_9ACTN|nr:carbohydrate ABC transporter permease [Kribbella voronezhensis]TDU83379.1 carbohydrate ABC transporter membrane protein 2 (CUT1 family) [Kribbella voronezhensis]
MTTQTLSTPRRLARQRAGIEAGRPVWEEQPSWFGRLSKPVVLALVALLVTFPLYVVVVTSLSTTEAVTRAGGLVVVPRELTIAAYVQLLSGGVVTRALLISTAITFVGTAFSLGLTVLAAYGLSRPGSLLHRPLLFIVLLTFLFGPGIIPSYLVVNALGLIDSYGSLILPTAISAFNLIVMRSFFMGIPGELIDSARIDGAGEFAVLSRIVLPLSKAVVAVVGLFYAVGYWNAFFNAMLYINDNNKWPLQMVLRTYIVQAQVLPTGAGGVTSGSGMGLAPAPSLAIKMAIVVIAVVPVLVIYPFIQRHFTKGVIIGAVKG